MNDTAKQEIILFDKNKIVVFNEFKSQLDKLKSDSEKIIPDLTTKKGIDSEVSYIYKIKKTKAALDRVRKSEKQNSLEYGREIDRQAGQIRDELESIITARERPILEIKEKEEKRVQAHKENIESLNEYMTVGSGAESSVYINLLGKVNAFQIDDSLEEFQAEAKLTKDAAIAHLERYIEERQKYEREQAELQILRQEKMEREERDRKKEEAERIKKLQEEAAKKAIKEAEEKVEKERVLQEQREQAEKQQAIAREERLKREKAEAEQRAAEAERHAKEKAEKELLEKQRQEEAEAKRREEDLKHRKKINNQTKSDLVKVGLSDEVAEAVIVAVAKGQVRNLKITY